MWLIHVSTRMRQNIERHMYASIVYEETGDRRQDTLIVLRNLSPCQGQRQRKKGVGPGR